MKLSVVLLLALLSFSELLQAATNGIAPELLSYNLRTTVEAYEKGGRRNPKRDTEAKGCLKAFAEIRSETNAVPTRMLAELRTNLPSVISLKCDDPMIRYLHARYVLTATRSSAELVPVFNEVVIQKEKGLEAFRSFPVVESFPYRVVRRTV